MKEFEMITVCGIPALFSNGRITDADMPKGLFCYHLRHGDDGNFATLEKSVVVNHAGSVVTKEPIDLGGLGYIEFNEVNSPNFIGEYTDLDSFAARS